MTLVNQIETYLDGQEISEINIEDLYTILVGYQSSPLDINSVTYEDLLQLQVLDEIKIQAFLDYRANHGPILAIEELQIINGWTADDARFLSAFTSIRGGDRYQLSIPQMAIRGKQEVYLKWKRVLNHQLGYDPERENGYLGDQNNYTVRWRYNYENRMKYGMILEKDAGEEFFNGTNPQGFDYLSFHYYLKDYSKLIKDVALGDYTISMGQGLITHNDFGAGKSAWVNDIKLGGRPIKSYNSLSENLYNRGVAARLHPFAKVDITLFGSYTQKDGNLLTQLDTLPDGILEDEFTSFQLSGYHRTLNEVNKEKTVDELKYGGIIKWYDKNYHVALNYQQHNFSAALTEGTQLYNQFRFAGDRLTNVSLDYGYRWRNLNVFGEVAQSFPGGMAQLHGLLIGLDRHVSGSVLYRNYQRDYQSIFPNAFGEGSSITNESGLYLGLEVKPNYNWTLRLYADLWKHPWLKFQTDAPTNGKEYLARLDYTIKRKFNMYAQYFYENKYSNNSSTLAKINYPEEQTRHKLRIHASQQISKALELRSRVEFTRFEQGNESKGFAAMQDVIYKPIGFPLSLTSRIVLFDTDDYDSRVYAYENDILYEFYIPAYFYKGLRYYINLRYKVNRVVTAEFRYAHTRFSNRDIVGSSLDLIQGNVRNDIKAQVRFKF